MNNSVLFVTAFKDLGREDWAGFKRPVSQYIEWFRNLSVLPIRLICFCDKDIESLLQNTCDFYNTYPYEEQTTFLQFIDKERDIMNSTDFKNIVRHRNDPETNKPGYNSVNHNKFWFIKKARSMLPNYTYYAWVDFGCYRERDAGSFQYDFSSLGNKIVYGVPKKIDIVSLLSPINACINMNNQCLFGSEFFCPSDLVEWYYNEYYNMVMYYYSQNLVDDDQEIVKQILKIHSDKFALIVTDGWFQLLKTFKTHLYIDVVIPTCLKDIDTLKYAIKGARDNISNIRNIYIIAKNTLKNEICGEIFIDEENFPFSIQDVAEYVFGERNYPGNHGRSQGWWFQQLIKLYAFKVIKGISTNIMIIDSETIFYNKYTPIHNNMAYYAVSNEINKEYRKHMKLLINEINIKENISGICHQMLFQAHILNNIFDRVELKYNTPLWKMMLLITKHNNRLSYSEYDMYFNFILSFHKNTVTITNKIKWDISTIIPEKSDYTFLTAHAHIRNGVIKADSYFVNVDENTI